MFVKFENYYDNDKHLILNVDNIVAVTTEQVLMANGGQYKIDQEQYEALCRILTKKL